MTKDFSRLSMHKKEYKTQREKSIGDNQAIIQKRDRWKVSMLYAGKRVHLGYTKTREEALDLYFSYLPPEELDAVGESG